MHVLAGNLRLNYSSNVYQWLWDGSTHGNWYQFNYHQKVVWHIVICFCGSQNDGWKHKQLQLCEHWEPKKLFSVFEGKSLKSDKLNSLMMICAYNVCVCSIIVIIINEHNKKKFITNAELECWQIIIESIVCVCAFVEISCRHLAFRNNSLNNSWWIFIRGAHKFSENARWHENVFTTAYYHACSLTLSCVCLCR